MKKYFMLLCPVFLFGCGQPKEKENKYEETKQAIESIARIQAEERANQFGIDKAIEWLENKIWNANPQYSLVHPYEGRIKTIKINYLGEELLGDRFQFAVTGVDKYDTTFKYIFVLQKINGYYSISETNAPDYLYIK